MLTSNYRAARPTQAAGHIGQVMAAQPAAPAMRPFGGFSPRGAQTQGAGPAGATALQAATNAGAAMGQPKAQPAPLWEPGAIGQQLGGV